MQQQVISQYITVWNILHMCSNKTTALYCVHTHVQQSKISRYYVALYYMKYIIHNIKTITAYFVATYDKQQQAVIYYCGKYYYMQK